MGFAVAAGALEAATVKRCGEAVEAEKEVDFPAASFLIGALVAVDAAGVV